MFSMHVPKHTLQRSLKDLEETFLTEADKKKIKSQKMKFIQCLDENEKGNEDIILGLEKILMAECLLENKEELVSNLDKKIKSAKSPKDKWHYEVNKKACIYNCHKLLRKLLNDRHIELFDSFIQGHPDLFPSTKMTIARATKDLNALIAQNEEDLNEVCEKLTAKVL